MKHDETTFGIAREILKRKHRDACLAIHAMILEEGTTNREFPALVKARKDEIDAADNIMRLNDVVHALEQNRS